MLGGVVMLASVGYDLLERYYPQLIGRSPGGEPVRVASSSGATGPVAYSLPNIVNAHLFGIEVKKKKPKIEQVPETKLKLSLLGVFGSTSTDYARALIRVNSKQTKAYSIGEQIENTDAKIHTVESHKVILDRGGTYESLMMTRSKIDNVTAGLKTNTAAALQTTTATPTGSTGGSRKSNSSLPF